LKRNILIICYSNHVREPRLHKVVNALKHTFNIYTAGYKKAEIDNVEFISINLFDDYYFSYPLIIRQMFSMYFRIKVYFKRKVFLSVNKMDFYYSRDYKKLGKMKFDLIISHHLNSMPLASELVKKNDCKWILNAHEFYPMEFGDKDFLELVKPDYEFLCKKYLSKPDLMFNVCEPIAKKYKIDYGIDSVVINNASPYNPINPNWSSGPGIKFIHHGLALRQREIEIIIDSFNGLPSTYTLDLMLINSDDEYYEFLSDYVRFLPNIRLIEPVKINEITTFINKYDVGICFVPANSFNNEFLSPNKLFEYIQAKLAVISGPNKLIEEIVVLNNIGLVSDSYDSSSLNSLINSLTIEKINDFKLNTIETAKVLCAELTQDTILNNVNNLMSISCVG
jgi:hypothetical protein